MKKIVATALFTILSGCASPHIVKSDSNVLQISLKEKIVIEGQSDLLLKRKLNLINLQIDQKVFLMQDRSVLTYEDVRVSSAYELSYGMNRTVGIIFPQYKYTAVDFKGNIYFYKLENKKSVVYLILENINKKRVKMVYGLSESLFNTIHKRLTLDKVMNVSRVPQLKSINVDADKENYIQSNWSHKSIILYTIIRKVGYSNIGK